jgi:biotin carboxyl carrier protein
MKLTVEVNKEDHELSFERDGEHLFARVDDRTYEVSVREIDDGLYLFTRDGDVFECLVEKDRAHDDTFTVHLRNNTYVTTVTDPRQLGKGHGSSAHAGDGSGQITSPMAGKVVRVLVELGTSVKTGDGIVVVEAMKMQNELKASRDGVVGEINAVEGRTVDSGEVLAIIEAVTD